MLCETQYIFQLHLLVFFLACFILRREVTRPEPPTSQLKQNASIISVSVRLAPLDHIFLLCFELLLLVLMSGFFTKLSEQLCLPSASSSVLRHVLVVNRVAAEVCDRITLALIGLHLCNKLADS